MIDLTEEDDDAPVQANRQSNTNGNLPPLVVFQNEARSGVQSTKNNQQQLCNSYELIIGETKLILFIYFSNCSRVFKVNNMV